MSRELRRVGQAYVVHEGWRRKALFDAIAVLNRAHEDKAANILRRMRDAAEEDDPNRPSLAGDDREACRRKTLSHAIAVLKDHKENAAACILHRMLDAEQRGSPQSGG
jgi:hypothetical protein